MRHRIGEPLIVRLSAPVRLALRKRAKRCSVSQAEYVRKVLKTDLMTFPESDIAFKQVLKQSDIALQRFHSHVKRFILICRGVAIAAKLPGTDRRDKLEEAAWAALQDAVEWMKTEEAAENARARAVVVATFG